MRSLAHWGATLGVGLYRSTVFAGVGLIVPLLSAVLPVAALLGLGSGPWSWSNPWSWISLAIIVAALGLVLAHPVAVIHRRLLRRWSGVAMATGYQRQPKPVLMSTGFWWNGYSYERTRRDAEADQRLRRVAEPAYLIELRWVLIAALLTAPVCALPLAMLVGAATQLSHPSPLRVSVGLLLVVVGAAAAPLTWRVVAPAAERWLRVPTRTAARIPELERQRAEMISTHDAEIRRIERDLHDGAQARLVAVGLDLAAAERLLEQQPERALALLREARRGTSASLTELRELVHGVYPAVLTERGAVEAIRALALDSPSRVHVTAPTDLRLDRPVEAAIYFAVAELITNAVKYAPGAAIEIVLRSTSAGLETLVSDDGPGGALVGPAGGLSGIRQRLGAFDGSLSVASPPGGPTVARMWVPCESS